MSHHQVNQLIHIMWSTLNQQYSFSTSLKSELHAYITALIKSKNGKVFATGGAADHIHLLILLPPDISLVTLIGHVKAYTSKWLKSREAIDPHFSWQNGYLAISTQKDRMDNVCAYIRSDKERHQSKSYSEELIWMLKQQNIEYLEQYYQQNSYSKVYIHAVWSTHKRIPYLEEWLRPNLYNLMMDVVCKFRGIVHEIGGIEDHVHILMEVPRDKALSEVIREVKTSAVHWIKSKDRMEFKNFEWQTGYGAFTVSHTNIDVVKRYIMQQKEHHRIQTFQEEWNDFLHKNEFSGF